MNVNKININQSELTYNILSDAGYLYAGIATPSTNPGTLDSKVVYFANTPGTYQHFDNITVEPNQVVALYNIEDGSWESHEIANINITTDKIVNGAVTTEKLADSAILKSKLEKTIGDVVDNVSAYNDIELDTTEEQVWCNDEETEEYVKIGKDGIKSKAYMDIDGNPIKIGTDNITDKSVTTKKLEKSISDIIDNVTTDTNITDTEEQVWCNDEETEKYVKIGKDGIKSKAYMDIDGNPIQLSTDIVTKKIICLRNGTEGIDCDFAGLNAIHRALESITDNDYYHRYLIIAKGHFIFNQVCFEDDGNDVTRDYWSSVTGATVRQWVGDKNEWLANVYGKDYVTIDGSTPEETSIEVYLNQNTIFPIFPNNSEHYNGTNIHVLFNACHWSEFRNITFVGYNTRYCLHTENANPFEESYAKYYNCRFIYKKDYVWTSDDGTTTGVFNAADALGLGIRSGYDWFFKECEITCDADGKCLGGHSGFAMNGKQKKVAAAKLTFDDCRFCSKNAIGMGTYYELADSIHLNNCNFKTGSILSTGSIYPSTSLLEMFPMKIYSNGKHLAYGSLTNNVLKITNGNSVNKITVCQLCSAFVLFSSEIFNENQLLHVERDFDGSFNFNGYNAKYGATYGYVLGKRPISMDKDKSLTLGKLLGDCTSVNKELSIYIDDVLVTKSFTSNYLEMSNEDVISELNSKFSENDITFSLFDRGLTEELICGFSEEVINIGSIPLYKHMGVVFDGNGVRAAKEGEKIDAICISYITPINSYARICTQGEFYGLYGVSNISNGKFYKIGSNDGAFSVSEEPTNIKAINNIFKII